jgi:outer membrane protein assembly factor BamB
MFYPLQTVDAVVSGKQVVVFDKANKKLWEGTLAAPVVQSEDPAVVPCLENRGNLYVLDAETLHCFDVKSGEVRWRVPGPGMSTMAVDPDGQIYVKVNETLRKIDPAKGKELWSMDIFAKVDGSPGRLGALGVLRGLGMGSREADFTLVGKDLYLFKAQVSSHDVLQHLSMGKDLPTHFRIVRISPRSGEIKWEHYTPRAPVAMDIRENRIAIVYPTVYKRDPNNRGKLKGEGGELQILSYLDW